MSPSRSTTDITEIEPTPWERLFANFRGPGGGGRGSEELPDFSRMSDEDKRQYISRLNPIERTIAYLAAVLAVVIDLIIELRYMIEHPKVIDTRVKPAHHHCTTGFTYTHVAGKAVCEIAYPASHYTVDLIVPLVFAVVVVVTIRFAKRSAVAFAVVLAGLPFGVPLLLPFAAGGGWIMLRAWRTQKYGVPNQKHLQDGWVPPAARTSGRKPRPNRPTTQTTGRSGSMTKSKAPTANKRYTPRTPPKPVKKGSTR